MTIIALTGGIGSGKSEVARQFSALGVPIVDLDVIAHALTATGEPLLTDIVGIFGGDFLNKDNTLNRIKLREHVLQHPQERLKLEALLHPAIYQRAIKQLHDNEINLHPSYQILVIPLFFENNRYDSVVDTVLVIDCDEAKQIKRAMARSQMTELAVKTMMAAQVSRTVRLSLADAVILNNGSLAELQANVTKIHKKFIKTCIVSKYI
ncbi:MAG: dephospho-CoA kinase [Methylotenera sp.]|nr:dephospho-CoA kinase [Methylotenera sp.]MSP99410.1 dephospho-CoA kinase [Methylotenera sp.]